MFTRFPSRMNRYESRAIALDVKAPDGETKIMINSQNSLTDYERQTAGCRLW